VRLSARLVIVRERPRRRGQERIADRARAFRFVVDVVVAERGVE
jgi:hypothetical protein